MSYLTGLALRRRSVTVLAILLILGGGIGTYTNLQVELFPEIEFPLVTVTAFYPSANPDAVVSDVTVPIENAVSGAPGLDSLQSISSENLSLILASYKFGTDMAEAERTISGRLNSIEFPDGVRQPTVARINPDAFPVLQLSVLSERDIPDIQRLVESQVTPAIMGVDGVFSVDVTGGVDRQLFVTVDSDRLRQNGVSIFQLANALQDNNVTIPAGAVTEDGQTYPVRTTHSYGSVDELRDLVIGLAGPSPSLGGVPGGAPPSGQPPTGGGAQGKPVLLSDVADVGLGAGVAASISRTNGLPSLGIAIIKEPEANTVDVTRGVLEALEGLAELPPDVEIVTILNDGPEIQAQIDTLQREGLFGFLFAVTVVFAFLLTLRPSLLRGLELTLRPTLVISLSIPLSIFTGILLMGLQGMTLNFMTLGGLAISVGRVVDDSIVVLENVYRHMQRGENRFATALEATREVAPAIVASTLTTIVVFVPLVFLEGLVGSFFLPFAQTVTYALLASLLVALTAVPVVGALLVRPGDFEAEGAPQGGRADHETWMQRVYTPVLVWALGHKAVTLIAATVVTVASLGLIAVIPINLFGSSGVGFVAINVSLPPGSSVERTFAAVEEVESVLARLTRDGAVDAYQTTVGTPEGGFLPGAGPGIGGSGRATILLKLTDKAPESITENLRAELVSTDERSIVVTAIGDGPPTSGVELNVTGSDYGEISDVATRLAADIGQIPGLANVTSDVAESRDEVVIRVKPDKAAGLGLTARTVAFQVNQFIVGRVVTQVALDGAATDVVLRGNPEDVDRLEKIKALVIAGPMGSARLDEIADVGLEKGPVTISRIDRTRAATVTGAITTDDAQAVGIQVQERIDSMDTPPGVRVEVGGVFQQIAEAFQDIFLAMAVGIVLVYLVMAASMGSLKNPFVIVMSLPLALIGTLVALAVTGRTLGLPAMMGLLLLIGIVVTNAIVLIAFVEQLRERGLDVHEALIEGGRVRLRPILMTGFTTSFALLPLAAFVSSEGGIIGAELATVVIGGLVSSTFLTLVVVPVVYTIVHVSLPSLFRGSSSRSGQGVSPTPEAQVS